MTNNPIVPPQIHPTATIVAYARIGENAMIGNEAWIGERATMSDREHVEELLNEDQADLRSFHITIEGAEYREGCSNPWRPYRESATARAEIAAGLLIKLATGFGLDAEMLPELPDDESEITITIKPADTSEEEDDG